MTSDLLECVDCFEVVVSLVDIQLPEVCDRSSCVFIMQPAEFLTGHTLQIARRKGGPVGIGARGHAPQRSPTFVDSRATYVRGDAPSIAHRSGELTQLFCLRVFSKNEKRWRSAAKIFRGR